MADMYLARLARVVPPRDTGPMGSSSNNPSAPGVRVVACSNATVSVRLDNDIFELSPPSGAPGYPGSYGRALVRFQGDPSVDLFLLFGQASSVSANSAATTGNTMCGRLPAGQERDFELDPAVDKYFSATTANGTANTGTLRYWIVSYPTNTSPGSG